MNKEQIAYNFARFDTDTGGFITGSFLTGSAYLTSVHYIPEISPFCAIASIGSLSVAVFKYLKSRLIHNRIKNEELDSINEAEEVIISDSIGLEHLLERTKEKNKKEWGTVFNANYNDKLITISEILDSSEAERNGFIIERAIDFITVNIRKLAIEGYNGVQHFHTGYLNFMESFNYKISINDRSVGNPDWIQLLTFNINDQPEIIAYNRTNTYIPYYGNKSHLIRADDAMILEYLKK